MPPAPSHSLQEEFVFWGHVITPRRKLLRLKYRVLYVTLSARKTGGRLGTVSLQNNDSFEVHINTQSVSYYDNVKEQLAVGCIFIMKTGRKVNDSE